MASPDIVFGSEILGAILDAHLRTLPVVVETFGENIADTPFIPDDMPFPAFSWAVMEGTYDGPTGRRPRGRINREDMTVVTRGICEGETSNPIRDAMKAIAASLEGERFDYAADGHQFHATFTAAGEVLPTRISEGKVGYRQLGTIYRAALTWA